jgi:anti-sigma-K factor RskA
VNDRIDDLIALAALGELNAQESAELDAAVASDPRLAEELTTALAGAAALQSWPIESPPPTLKASVMAAIAGVPQEQVAPAAPGTHDTVELPVEPAPRRADDRDRSVVEHIEPTGRRTRRWAPLLAAAAVLAVVFGGVMIASDDSAQDDPIAAVVEADDAVAHSVTGPIGELEFVYSAEEDAFVLVGDSLDAVPAASTYQVWLVNDGNFTSLGTFEPDPDGSMEMRADGIDPTGSTVGITVEPVGGSDEPTLPPVAASA